MLQIAFTCSRDERSNFLYTRYIDALCAAGERAASPIAVAPVILPQYADPSYLDWCFETFDGFVFTGGPDLNPATYGETNDAGLSEGISPVRDEMEFGLIHRLLTTKKKAALGICRGIQSMGAACGIPLWQDFPSQTGREQHCQKGEDGYTHHTVHFFGILRDILGTDAADTNSYHHQALRPIPEALSKNILVTGISEDGIIEGIHIPAHPFFVGVQWHPEIAPNEISWKLFVRFLEAVRAGAQ